MLPSVILHLHPYRGKLGWVLGIWNLLWSIHLKETGWMSPLYSTIKPTIYFIPSLLLHCCLSHTWMPMERHLPFLSASFLYTSRWSSITAPLLWTEGVGVQTVMALLLTCWLAGPWTYIETTRMEKSALWINYSQKKDKCIFIFLQKVISQK